MVEYEVILKRYEGSSRPDVCVFRDENRELAIREMGKYVNKYGFTVVDRDGRFTIAGVHLIEKEPIAGSPIISEVNYYDIFDIYGNRRRQL